LKKITQFFLQIQTKILEKRKRNTVKKIQSKKYLNGRILNPNFLNSTNTLLKNQFLNIQENKKVLIKKIISPKTT
jgi:hypothetical protein